MLQTIQVEIDATGRIHPMEELSFRPVGRALLTLLDTTIEITNLQMDGERGSVARAMALLSLPRFSSRPAADTDEVRQRINDIRNEWDENR